MLPHYPLYIGLQITITTISSPHPGPIPFPLDLPVLTMVLPHLSSLVLTVGSCHFVLRGGKVLAHATLVSSWPLLVIAALTKT